MTPLLLAAALAAAPAPSTATGSDGQRFLAVVYDVWGDTRMSFTHVYETVWEAEKVAEQIGLCGFWRVDLATAKDSLMAAGAVREIHLIDPADIPPPPVQEKLRQHFGDPLPLPPPPDVSRLVECQGWRLRLRVRTLDSPQVR